MNIYSLSFIFLFQFLSCNQALEFPQASLLPESQQKQKIDKSVVANIVFKSTDGGQSWQDISEGLPGDMEETSFFTNETGLYLSAGHGIYHSKPNSTAPFWKKEVSPGQPGSIAPGKHGIYAYNYEGEILQKTDGTSEWSPVYSNFKGTTIRTVFETAGGTVFIGSDNGLFKSSNSGKTWKHVFPGGWVIKLAESDGVLLATSMGGIIRSADDGENWSVVISEGGVGIDVACIRGGFAAISFNTQSNTRRVRTSYDGGNTWQPIDAGLQPQYFKEAIWRPNNNNGLPPEAFITSIIQVGETFFCGHPAGIFRSYDKGKTWELLLPSVKNKVFNLYVSGNVIYALPRNGGC